MYLNLALSAFLTLFTVRTQEHFFFNSHPHPILACAGMIAITCSLMISLFWKCGHLDDVSVCGLTFDGPHLLPLWVILYCLVVFLIQDTLKVLLFIFMRAVNLFGINDTSGRRDENFSQDEGENGLH
jgi:H+-transporting ATPase